METSRAIDECRATDVEVAQKVMGWKYVGNWSPSTLIGCAWNVVDRLAQQGIFLVNLSNVGQVWRCVFYAARPDQATGVQSEAEADAAPLAICRAALKSVARRTRLDVSPDALCWHVRDGTGARRNSPRRAPTCYTVAARRGVAR